MFSGFTDLSLALVFQLELLSTLLIVNYRCAIDHTHPGNLSMCWHDSSDGRNWYIFQWEYFSVMKADLCVLIACIFMLSLWHKPVLTLLVLFYITNFSLGPLAHDKLTFCLSSSLCSSKPNTTSVETIENKSGHIINTPYRFLTSHLITLHHDVIILIFWPANHDITLLSCQSFTSCMSKFCICIYWDWHLNYCIMILCDFVHEHMFAISAV